MKFILHEINGVNQSNQMRNKNVEKNYEEPKKVKNTLGLATS